MDPLSITASIANIIQLTTNVIKYLDAVKDAPKECALFAVEASNLSALLRSLRYQLDNKGSNEPWWREVNSLGVQDGPLDQYKDALQKLQHKVQARKGLAKVTQALVWNFNKDEVASILSRIERLKSLVQIALQMDHFKLSQQIKNYMDGVQNDTQGMRADVSFLLDQVPVLQDSMNGLDLGVWKLQLGANTFQKDADHQKHLLLMDWISSSNFPAQQSDLIGARQEGTGQWFLDSPEFARWVNGENETLLCPGIPGAGKTMIAAITINHLVTTIESETIGVAYIFCNYKAQAEQSTTFLLAAILKQLVQARPSISEPVSHLHEHHRKQNTRPAIDGIFTTLQAVVKSLNTVYIVIDALDECSNRDGTRNHLCQKLTDLQRIADVRLLITSRIPEIENKFILVPRLEIRASDEDVKRFIAAQIQLLPRCIQRDNELQKLVEDKIAEMVNGMFLLARLYMNSLQDKRTKAKVLTALENRSTSSQSIQQIYDEAYAEAVKRIEAQLPEDSKSAKQVLAWITYAQRALTVAELCHALAVKPGDDDLDQDNIPEIEDLILVCAGLVTVDEESDIVRLVHFTTQEYFERIRDDWNAVAELEIASVCMTYLSFSHFKIGSRPDHEEFERRLRDYRLLDYSSRYWAEHSRNNQKQIYDLAFSFFSDMAFVSCAWQVESITKYEWTLYSQRFPSGVTGLHLTARLGLTYLFEKLLSGLETKHLVNKGDDGIQTPLAWAARNGRESVVKLLLALDNVDANAENKGGRTPLSWAAEKGHEEIVRLLLARNDVNADSKDTEGRTPLLWAVVEGHQEIVKPLLARDDVDADSKDEGGRTPLSWAAVRGHEDIVKLLLTRDDIKVNSENEEGRTPLLLATRAGHKEIVKLLLALDAVDTDSRDKRSRTPLSWAAAEGHEEVVKLLLAQKDVDADSKDENGMTPLSWAAKKGRKDVAKLLLARDDVDPDSEDNSGNTPQSRGNTNWLSNMVMDLKKEKGLS